MGGCVRIAACKDVISYVIIFEHCDSGCEFLTDTLIMIKSFVDNNIYINSDLMYCSHR